MESKDKGNRGGGGSTKNTVKMKFLTVMTLLPHVFPGNSALRKKISATSTWIYQFTGDKTGNRKTSSLLSMTVLKSFLPQTACWNKTTDFFLTFPLADLNLN